MEKIVYTKQQVEQALNLLNMLSFTGFDAANKLSTVFQILNNPVIENKEIKSEEFKENK